MNLIEEAFKLLYPEKEFNYSPRLVYSGRFKDYNANVQLYRNVLEFKLSKKWQEVSREIQIGLMQELMLKLFKGKKSTMNIDLYNSFVKNLHYAIPKTKSHPLLVESFNRMNQKYFYDLIEQPNLVWGSASKTQLGTYDFKTDTITISKVFSKTEPVLLDFIMYHEMLHKKHKFSSSKGGRHTYHSSSFRQKEKEFEDYAGVDSLLKKRLRHVKFKDFLFGRL
jgi:predicted metal-dependent hydrolase